MKKRLETGISVRNQESSLQLLEIRKLEKTKKLKRLRTYFRSSVSALLFFFPTLLSLSLLKIDILSQSNYFLLALILAFTVSLVGSVFLFGTRVRQTEEEIQDICFEIDLLQYDVSPKESRAEKLLRISNVELRRYYNLNLSQNSWVLCLGIFCLLIGATIIGFTLFVLLRFANDTETKVIAGAAGTISSFFVNYVAAIYLKIHAEASNNLSLFHARLVETHQMLLANLIASGIENESTRWDAFSQLSASVGKKHGSAESPM